MENNLKIINQDGSCCNKSSDKSKNFFSVSFGILTFVNIILFISFINYNFFSYNLIIIFKYHILEIICFLITFSFTGINLVKNFFRNIKKKFFNIENIILFSSLIITIYSLFFFFWNLNDIFNNLNYDQSKDNVIFYSASLLLYFSEIGIKTEKYIFLKTEKTSDILSDLQPKYVKCIDLATNKIKKKFYQDLEINDLVVVKKNAIIPADGYVVNDVNSIISTKIWTGNDLPRSIEKNSYVSSGDINLGQEILIRVAKKYQDFALTYLISKIKNYKKTPQKYQKISEIIVKYLTIIILLTAFLTFLIHLILGILNHNLILSKVILPPISVLVIFCPCALGITIPLLLAITASKASKNNIVINDPNLIDKISLIDTVVFDKTGTLTKNEIYFENLTYLDNNPLYLSILKSLEQKSQHPIAQSVLNMLASYQFVNVTDVKEIIGVGVFGKHNDKDVAVISKENATKKFPNLKIANFNQEIFLIYDNKVVVGFDKKILFRKETVKCLYLLKKLKYNVYVITGDNKLFDDDLAKIIDADNIFTRCSPNKKLSIVKSLKNQRNLNLIYVGDGINDILSLKEANISVGIGSRFDLSSIRTDIVLINNNLLNILYILFLLKRTKKFIVFSLVWSIAYNLFFAFIASFGLISPVFSGLIMVSSDVLLLLIATFFYLWPLKF